MCLGKQIVSIGGEQFEADVEMIPLLRELNKAGLKTVRHCFGHNTGVSWVRLDMSCISGVDYALETDGTKRLVISWKHPSLPEGLVLEDG